MFVAAAGTAFIFDDSCPSTCTRVTFQRRTFVLAIHPLVPNAITFMAFHIGIIGVFGRLIQFNFTESIPHDLQSASLLFEESLHHLVGPQTWIGSFKHYKLLLASARQVSQEYTGCLRMIQLFQVPGTVHVIVHFCVESVHSLELAIVVRGLFGVLVSFQGIKPVSKELPFIPIFRFHVNPKVLHSGEPFHKGPVFLGHPSSQLFELLSYWHVRGNQVLPVILESGILPQDSAECGQLRLLEGRELSGTGLLTLRPDRLLTLSCWTRGRCQVRHKLDQSVHGGMVPDNVTHLLPQSLPVPCKLLILVHSQI